MRGPEEGRVRGLTPFPFLQQGRNDLNSDDETVQKPQWRNRWRNFSMTTTTNDKKDINLCANRKMMKRSHVLAGNTATQKAKVLAETRRMESTKLHCAQL